MKEEKVDFDQMAIEQIARAGRGSLRDSLTITDQAIAFCEGKLSDSEVAAMLGTLPSDNVLKLLRDIADGDSKSLLASLNEINQLSVDYLRLMDLLLETIQFETGFGPSMKNLSIYDLGWVSGGYPPGYPGTFTPSTGC